MLSVRSLFRRIFGLKRKLKTDRARSLLYIGVVILLVGAIGFSIYQVARHLTVGLNTLRTQEITDESYVRMDLYIFRDEAVLNLPGSDTYLYDLPNGGRLGKDQTICTAYAVGDEALSKKLQATLNAYGDRIALLRELGGTGTPEDVRDVALGVDQNYLDLLEAVKQGDLSSVDGYAAAMLEGLGRYDMLTGGAGRVSVATLTAERAALVAGHTSLGSIRHARSGYFYYDTDGFETVFPYSAAMTMTAEEFKAMTTASAKAPAAGTVGKMVYNPTWYAATYLSLSDGAVELFQQGFGSGRAYTVTCLNGGGVKLTLKVERFEPDAEGVLVVFSSQDMPAGFDFSRKISVETVAYETSGYRIPSEALVTLKAPKTGNEVTGVYVLSGNVVEFRKIRIHVSRDGYVIAYTYEDAKAEQDALMEQNPDAFTDDGWSYLGLNDNIITGGNDLYEGKVIG